MKYLILALFTVCTNAGATEPGSTYIGDPEIGNFGIHITENIEPVWHKWLYTLTVECKGRKEVRELRRIKICEMKGHRFDQTTKQVVVEYEVADTTLPDDTPCNVKKFSLLDLKKECATRKK